MWDWILEHKQQLEDFAMQKSDCGHKGRSAARARQLIPEDGRRALLAAILADNDD